MLSIDIVGKFILRVGNANLHLLVNGKISGGSEVETDESLSGMKPSIF